MMKFRLYPNRTQTKKLTETLEDCRYVYNTLLANHKKTYEETGKTLNQYGMNKALKHLKDRAPILSGVHSQILQNVSKRIKDGYTNFFARRKAGLKAGLPRFKKYGQYKSLTYPQTGFKIEGKKLVLSKIGSVKIKLHRPTEGRIKTLTVKRMPSGKWFAAFSCQQKQKPQTNTNGAVGIDVGIKSFAILSDETVIENPRFYRKSQKKLAKLQRRLSRKKPKSKNRDKARIKVALCHEKVVNQRTDFLHKETTKLANSYSLLKVEDLKVCNMLKNHCLAKSIADASWGSFFNMLSYKASSAGGKVVKVAPHGTTKKCSRCGFDVPKKLSDRVHVCPNCGLKMDRDLNAAININLKLSREPREVTPMEISPLLSLSLERASEIEEIGSHLTC